MTSIPSDSRHLTASTLLMTGAALTAVAGVIGLAGATLTAVGAAKAVRRRIEQMNVPPSELARQQWRRARIAARAGAGAWRDQGPTTVE
jgi:membrane-bound ClpP family serine protease